jgi:hypothetical protein
LRRSRTETFALICQAACERPQPPAFAAPSPIPHFSEPWYCCAEPTQEQFVSIAVAHPPGVLDLDAPELEAPEPVAAMTEAEVEVDVGRDVDVLP